MNINKALQITSLVSIGLYAGLGLLVGWMGFESLLQQGKLGFYLIWFVALPGSILLLCYQQRWLWLTPIYFLLQVVRPLNGESWFPANPPISLGFVYGDFSLGQGRFVDLFALLMGLLLLLCWRLQVRSRRGLKSV